MENIFDAKLIQFKSLLDVLFKELVTIDNAKQRINKKDIRKTIDITENLINNFENIKESIYSFEDTKDSNVISLETKNINLTKNLKELENEYNNINVLLKDKTNETIKAETLIKKLEKINLDLNSNINDYISKISNFKDVIKDKDLILQEVNGKLEISKTKIGELEYAIQAKNMDYSELEKLYESKKETEHKVIISEEYINKMNNANSKLLEQKTSKINDMTTEISNLKNVIGNLEERNNYLEKELIKIEKILSENGNKTCNPSNILSLDDEFKILTKETPLINRGSSCIKNDFQKMENDDVDTCKFCCIF